MIIIEIAVLIVSHFLALSMGALVGLFAGNEIKHSKGGKNNERC